MGSFVVVGGIVYLLKVIGPLSLLGLAVFLVFDALQVVVGISMVTFRRLGAKQTEERVCFTFEFTCFRCKSWERF